MSARAENTRLRGAIRAADERLTRAAIAVWGEDRHGCDTAEWLVDELMALRARLLSEGDRQVAEAEVARLRAFALTLSRRVGWDDPCNICGVPPRDGGKGGDPDFYLTDVTEADINAFEVGP